MSYHLSTCRVGEVGLVGTFSANLEAHEDPKTMRWWAEQPEAWAVCRTQTRDPRSAMLAATHRSAPEVTGRRPSRPLICRWTAPILRSETPIADPAGAADPMATIRWP